MASPDISPYVPLVLDGRDAQDMLESALDDATSKLPDWEPREGHTAVVLLEAICLPLAEIAYSLDRVPSSTAQAIFTLLGVVRDEGAAAATTVTFNVADTLGHDVPAGTRIAVPLPVDPDETTIFTTTAALAIAPGSSSGTIGAVAELVGTDPNGSVAGTSVAVIDALAYVDSAVLATAVANGRDVEADVEYFDRAVARTARLTDTLTKPAHFAAFALESPGVARALVVDNYDPAVGPVGSNAGHVSVAVMDDAGANLSDPDKAALTAAMDLLAMSQLTPHVIDATKTTVAVTATVHALPGQVLVDVQAAIVEALTAYLSPSGWPWSAKVRRYELISLLDGVAGVDYVDTIAAPAADVTLTGAAPVAVAGTLTITVQAAGT